MINLAIFHEKYHLIYVYVQHISTYFIGKTIYELMKNTTHFNHLIIWPRVKLGL